MLHHHYHYAHSFAHAAVRGAGWTMGREAAGALGLTGVVIVVAFGALALFLRGVR